MNCPATTISSPFRCVIVPGLDGVLQPLTMSVAVSNGNDSLMSLECAEFTPSFDASNFKRQAAKRRSPPQMEPIVFTAECRKIDRTTAGQNRKDQPKRDALTGSLLDPAKQSIKPVRIKYEKRD